MYVTSLLAGFAVGVLASAFIAVTVLAITAAKDSAISSPAITDSAITSKLAKIPPAPLEEEAIVPEDVDYDAREELFKKLKEENKIEYIYIK